LLYGTTNAFIASINIYANKQGCTKTINNMKISTMKATAVIPVVFIACYQETSLLTSLISSFLKKSKDYC